MNLAEKMKKIENLATKWLRPIPHLPVKGQNWLAKNIWWIVLVGLILSILGFLMLIGAIFANLAIMNSAVGYFGYNGAIVYSGWWTFASVVSVLFMIAVIIVSAMAISPLKMMKKRGWDLLFLALVISVTSSIVGAILNFNIFSFIFSIIMAAISAGIGAYFLLEIQSHFKNKITI